MHSEKATEFEKISHSNLKLLGTIDQKIMWRSQNMLTLVLDKITQTLKFGYSEKAKKFEKIFHLKFDVTE